ncbi:hypothetical protein P8882_03540 [Bacillus haynesii]|nr:hypothetical protein [Bacillus haynesii]
MLKLIGDVKYGKLPSEIQTHLTASSSNDEKIRMLVIVILFLDIICGIPLFVNGNIVFSMIALPLIIGINLWTIIVMFLSPGDRNDIHFTLYQGGVWGVISLCYFVLSQKYAHSVLSYNLLFISTSFITYFIMTLGFFRYFLIVFPNYKKKKIGTPAWGTYLLTIGSGIGYITAQIVFHFGDSVSNLFMSYIYLMLACTFSYMGVMFIHKFFFIKANRDIIDKHLQRGKTVSDRGARRRNEKIRGEPPC